MLMMMMMMMMMMMINSLFAVWGGTTQT